MSQHQDAEDAEAFREIVTPERENTTCFECGYPNPQWCDVHHGTMICIECSGRHRSLGVHLVFVRSSTIDSWMSWNPEKLKQMKLGGNRRARLYFEAHGVPMEPLQARYESDAALRYRSMLEAEARGERFDEQQWTAPEWKLKKKEAVKSGAPMTTGSHCYQGIGSSCAVSANDTSRSDWRSNLTLQIEKARRVAVGVVDDATETVREGKLQEKASQSATRAWSSVTRMAQRVSQAASSALDDASTFMNTKSDGMSSLLGRLEQGGSSGVASSTQNSHSYNSNQNFSNENHSVAFSSDTALSETGLPPVNAASHSDPLPPPRTGARLNSEELKSEYQEESNWTMKAGSGWSSIVEDFFE